MLTDARVLQPEFVPRDLQHRDQEVNHLSAALSPLTEGEHADPVLLHGPSGAGKTCTAQYIVEQLREAAVTITSQYVNCWNDHSRFKALYRLLDGITHTTNVHRKSTPTDELLDRVRDATTDTPYVVILDEVDQLEDKRLLYDLYRIPNLTMILITNDEADLFTPLDDRLNSRLTNCVRIHFHQYHDHELQAILQDRVDWGLDPTSITTETVAAIAQHAAGDARIAIGILRQAARRATDRGRAEITQDVVREVVPEAKSEIQQQTLDRLTSHQQALYDIITTKETIGPDALYTAYEDRVSDPKSRRMVRNYLSKLEHYNLIIADGNTKARVYHARDQTDP